MNSSSHGISPWNGLSSSHGISPWNGLSSSHGISPWNGLSSDQRTGALVTEPPNNSTEKLSIIDVCTNETTGTLSITKRRCSALHLPSQMRQTKQTYLSTNYLHRYAQSRKIVRTKKRSVNCRSNPCGFRCPIYQQREKRQNESLPIVNPKQGKGCGAPYQLTSIQRRKIGTQTSEVT